MIAKEWPAAAERDGTQPAETPGAALDMGDERYDEQTGPLTESISIFNEALHAPHRSLAISIDEIQAADLPSIRSIAASLFESAAT